VPIWSAFRYAEKLIGPLTLLLAVLAARARRRRGALKAGWLALASRRARAVAFLLGRHLAAGLGPEPAAMAGERLLRGGWQALAGLLALGGWALWRGRKAQAAGGGALALLVWAGAVAATPAALRPGDAAIRLASPGTALTAAAPGPRLVTPYTYEPLATEPGLDWTDQQGRDHAALGYPAHHVRLRLDSLADFMAMRPRRLALLQAALWPTWSREARRYGATHVVVAPPTTEDQRLLHDLATGGATLVGAAGGGGALWTVPHRAWASFPLEVRTVEDEATAIREVARSPYERAPPAFIETRRQLSAGPGQVLAVERGLESLRIEAQAERATTLLVADAWWPGWEATIDGAAVAIMPADALIRAVAWPAGRHVLEMRYRPPEVRRGLLISAMGLALLMLQVAWLRRRPSAP
jgi:hypothetical protein